MKPDPPLADEMMNHRRLALPITNPCYGRPLPLPRMLLLNLAMALTRGQQPRGSVQCPPAKEVSRAQDPMVLRAREKTEMNQRRENFSFTWSS